MNFDNMDALIDNHFKGFISIKDLWQENTMIPDEQGVYLVLNKNEKTEFLEQGVGGFPKNENPNVTIEELVNAFVPNSLVLYIGKSNNLKRRIKQYLKFGQGNNAPHRGGRYIWQIKHHQDLIICWKILPQHDDPGELETQLISEYKRQHNNNRPFANLQG